MRTLRTLICISYPHWPRPDDSSRQFQGACSELSKAVRDLADRIQHCGIGGGDVVLERESGLVATMRIELPDEPAAAA